MPKFSVKRPYVILVAVVMVLVLGGVSFSKMTTDLLPNMNMPYMMVITTYPGASPEKVETELTDVIENGVGTVNGVKEVTSTSSENYSMVVLEFEDDTNMDSAMVKVTSAVNQLDLPDNVDNPMVMELSADMMSTMMVSVDYKGKKGYELADRAEVWELEALIDEVKKNGGSTDWRMAPSAIKCPHRCPSPMVTLLALPFGKQRARRQAHRHAVINLALQNSA